MDEISLSSVTHAAYLKNGLIREFEIDPEEYGIKKAPLKAIVGGDGKENAQILHNIFDSKATDAQRDIVLLNAAAALMVNGTASDIQQGLEIAKETIAKGKAKQKLHQIIEISNKL
jgi:anthranilate phosphoribosyltransferase